MSTRGRPVNCRLHFYDIEEFLEKWLQGQMEEGNADNYVWDRVSDLDAPDFKRRFGKIIEDMIDSGDFDEAVKKRAEKQWGLQN
jgi:hypothetical protein